MKNFFLYTISTMVLCYEFSAFAQTAAENLLSKGEFKAVKAGSKLPTKYWNIYYNKAAKGKFIEDKSFKGKGQVLEIVNSVPKTFGVLNPIPCIELTKPGIYRASIWVKGGENIAPISTKWGKKCAVRILLRRSKPIKYFGIRKSLFKPILKDWKRYEFEFYAPESELGNGLFYFRVDITGRGTFYIAKPSLEKINETEVVKKKIESR